MALAPFPWKPQRFRRFPAETTRGTQWVTAKMTPCALTSTVKSSWSSTSRRQAVILSPSTAGVRAPVLLDFGRNRGGQLGDIGVAPGTYACTVYEIAQA